jgi:hypothetical protein
MTMMLVMRKSWTTSAVSGERARTLFIIVGVEAAPPGQREQRTGDVVVRNVKQLAQVPARLCQIAVRGALCVCVWKERERVLVVFMVVNDHGVPGRSSAWQVASGLPGSSLLCGWFDQNVVVSHQSSPRKRERKRRGRNCCS